MYSKPLAYLITFRTYGTWLPGDERGSVSRQQNRYGDPTVQPSRVFRESVRSRMKHAPVRFDRPSRALVDSAIREVCEHRSWTLHALNVRSNHVHSVITAETNPERVMNDLKLWSTRRLREADSISHGMTLWARHGSTKYIFDETSFVSALEYVLHGQDGVRFEDWRAKSE